MRKHDIHAGQSALALALAARTLGHHGVSSSVETHAGALTLIGPGTFLVAAYLGSRLCPNSLPGPGKADFHA
jgi:hypothetical protein